MTPQAIAHYKLTSKLGEGGMGVVWRATDTKLDREIPTPGLIVPVHRHAFTGRR